jgi:hypothetical protein
VEEALRLGLPLAFCGLLVLRFPSQEFGFRHAEDLAHSVIESRKLRFAWNVRGG